MPANVLTLIAAPAEAAQASLAVDAVVEGLRRLGAAVAPRRWLAPDQACDISFDDLDPDQADAAARAALAQLGAPAIDLVAQPAANRRKRLLLADMESTIIANEMLDELGDLLGLGQRIAEITRRAMNDELDSPPRCASGWRCCRARPRRRWPRSARASASPPAPRRSSPPCAPTAPMPCSSPAASASSPGASAPRWASISTSPTSSLVENGRLAGAVREPIFGRDGKLESLKRLAAEHGLPLAATLAVGDGANDIDMVEAAGLGVAFHAKPALAARARCRIDHADLTALLYVQGYSAEDVVSG